MIQNAVPCALLHREIGKAAGLRCEFLRLGFQAALAPALRTQNREGGAASLGSQWRFLHRHETPIANVRMSAAAKNCISDPLHL